jgi:Arc/MetJ family transcription regulator
MKFGVHSFIWTADFQPSDLPMLPRLKEQGFDGVELPLFNPATYPAAEIRKGFAEAGLESLRLLDRRDFGRGVDLEGPRAIARRHRLRGREVFEKEHGVSMRVNIVIDDALIREALRATGLRTKREVVELGLRTLLRLSGQSEIRRLRGKLDWQGDLESMRSDRVPTLSRTRAPRADEASVLRTDETPSCGSS